MRKLISNRPSPALVVAIVAMFAAVGGTSYAAITITGKNIKNNTVSTKDLKNNDVRGKDVRTNTLTGSDIKESKLGKVPSAAQADAATTASDAAALEGKSLRGVQQFVVSNSLGVVARQSGGVTVTKLPAAGRYRVSFPTDVSQCGLSATAGASGLGSDALNMASRFATVAHSSTGPNDVQVETNNHDGNEINNPFFLTVNC